MVRYHHIEHPGRLAGWRPEEILKLYREGRIPDPLSDLMVITTIRFGLRCVYTTNLRAAWSLLVFALWEKWEWSVVGPTERLAYRMRYLYVAAIYRLLQEIGYPVDLGRRESPEPARCDCGWAGRRRDATHGYQDDGTGQNEVEPVDTCPRCGQEV